MEPGLFQVVAIGKSARTPNARGSDRGEFRAE